MHELILDGITVQLERRAEKARFFGGEFESHDGSLASCVPRMRPRPAACSNEDATPRP
jgi:hypothetical protein